MRQILDLHIHSKYSRACSVDLTLANIDKTCRMKGVDIVATGDFTHPAWFKSIKEELTPLTPLCKGGIDLPLPSPCLAGRQTSQGGGNYCPPLAKGRNGRGIFCLKSAKDDKIKFILSTELSLIYKDGDRARRIHLVLHAPTIEAVEELNKYLGKSGFNIKSDGRPILGMSAPKLVELCLKIHPQFLIYPAHIWTPWFSVFGSKSGFNSMEECFHDFTPNIYAIETGLSSDPEMNWRLSALDNLTIISNSDAHSLQNIGREANIFEMQEISYNEIHKIIKNKKGIKGTIEFYPEEGMYHLDGHRVCGVSFTPEETKKLKGICPICKKYLVIGVLNRVEELADRPHFVPQSGTTAGKPEGGNPENTAPFYKLVGLDKIIAEVLGVKSRQSKQVKKTYDAIIGEFGSELDVLMDLDLKLLENSVDKRIIDGIRRVRDGRIHIKPGFDGQYGEVRVFGESEGGGQRGLGL